jgi:hypothetical protein
MTAVLTSRALAKRYGKRQALTDCTLSIFVALASALVWFCFWLASRRRLA